MATPLTMPFPERGHATSTPGGARWRTLPGAVALAAALALVAAFGGVQTPWYLAAYALLFITAAATLLAAALGLLPAFTPHKIHLALLALLALPLVQLAAGSTAERAATATAFLHLLAPATVFVLVGYACRDGHAGPAGRAFMTALGAIAGVLGIEALVQWFLTPSAIYGLVPIRDSFPAGPFVNRNDFAAALELTLPAVLLLALPEPEDTVNRRHIGWGLTAALALAAGVIASSRGGTLGIILEIALVISWRIHQQRQSRQPGHARQPGWAAATTLALVAGLALFAVAAGVGPLLQKFRTAGPTAQNRIELDRASLAMGDAKPWPGQGLGTWPLVYPRFARFDSGEFWPAAHDEYAQWWAETGILGTLVALALTACWLPSAFHHALRSPFAAAGAIAVAGFALHSTVDFLGHIPALALLFAVAAALAWFPTADRGGAPQASWGPRQARNVSQVRARLP